jgi:dipeptidyl-peptidase 9
MKSNSLFSYFTDGIYRIVYEEVDDSDVKIFCFPSSNADLGELEEFR